MTKNSNSDYVSPVLALKKIVEGTSTHTGQKFFNILVKSLAEALNVYGVWVTEYLAESNRLRALAFWLGDNYVADYEYDVPGTPCEPVLENESICHVPDNVIKLYPKDPDLPLLGAVSYMGIALRDENGRVLGHLALLDNKPMKELPEAFAVFKIFAARAAAELRRIRYEKMLIENEAKLKRIFDATHDSVIELNERLIITQANKAALQNFATADQLLNGNQLNSIVDVNSLSQIKSGIAYLGQQNGDETSVVIAHHINFIRPDQHVFPVEATLSKYRHQQQDYYALFLKDMSGEYENQKVIRQLSTETSILREKVSAHNFDTIIGNSPAILKACKAVEQVAKTESTVLIRGETGTGKELFAAAIHNNSKRKDKPMVRLNCAALPAELVESELFGHVKGAFTGAINAREGRFGLADGGTIFLDEIGELPLTLQVKLLRVLQEGEFEVVGSSKTVKVDVRVIAATNRDMEEEIRQGRFREDLFYRLNVFPIDVPPLRDRGNDILTLAIAFLEKYAAQANKNIETLSDVSKQILLSYHWPGNVRELQNVMERCVITAQNGRIDLSTLLSNKKRSLGIDAKMEEVMTEQEIMMFEKKNIINALERCNWQVSGKHGAAALLQIPHTTLNSRMNKLGIKRKF
jgi:PAS domain S-box-containing protein